MREAAAMLIIKDGLILGVPRKTNKEIFGLAGGKIDKNESAMEAAIRETKEETGLTVKSCIKIYERIELVSSDEKAFHTTCFYAIEWEGEIKSSEGEPKWLTEFELTTSPELGGCGAFPDYNRDALEAFKHWEY